MNEDEIFEKEKVVNVEVADQKEQETPPKKKETTKKKETYDGRTTGGNVRKT